MSESTQSPQGDIFDPEFWRQRLASALDTGHTHHAIYVSSPELWAEIATKHKEILARVLHPNDSILDAGCGWGRLLSLLPKWWVGYYLGVDLSPDFIMAARSIYPNRPFLMADLRTVKVGINEQVGDPDQNKFTWAICVSMRGMILREKGEAVWQQVEQKLKKVAKNILILEYDPQAEEVIL